MLIDCMNLIKNLAIGSLATDLSHANDDGSETRK